MTRIDNEKFGDLIRRLRKEKHMTQKELVFLLFPLRPALGTAEGADEDHSYDAPLRGLALLSDSQTASSLLRSKQNRLFYPGTLPHSYARLILQQPKLVLYQPRPADFPSGCLGSLPPGLLHSLFFRRRGSLGSLESHPPHRRPGRYGGRRLCRGKKTQITERRHGSPDGSHPAMSPFLSGLCFFTGSAQSQWLRACTGGIQSHPAARLPRRCIRTPCRQSPSCPRSWVWALRWSDSRCRSWCLYRS